MHSGLPIISHEKSDSSKPDIVCTLISEEIIEFELSEVCSEVAAKMMSDHEKGRKSARDFGYLENPVRKIVKNKKRQYQSYKSEHPIELLYFTDERIGIPSSSLAPMIQYEFCNDPEPFRRVWLMHTFDRFCASILPLDEFYEAVNRWDSYSSMWDKALENNRYMINYTIIINNLTKSF